MPQAAVLDGRGAERSSNFFLGFLFLPRRKREALAAVYAFCRAVDDISDSGALSREEAEKAFEGWRQEIARLMNGDPETPLGRRLLGPVREFSLPGEPFLEVMRGCSMDLGPAKFRDFSELEYYMDGVAGAVGELGMRIFGCDHTPHEKQKEFAVLFGRAFQLTNIIRDVGTDLEMGRVYIPDAEIAEAGYSREALAKREHSQAFERLMNALFNRARLLYRRARSLIDFRDRPRLLAAEIMAHVYEATLDKIRREGFPVLFERIKISKFEKAGAVARAWLYCHGL